MHSAHVDIVCGDTAWKQYKQTPEVLIMWQNLIFLSFFSVKKCISEPEAFYSYCNSISSSANGKCFSFIEVLCIEIQSAKNVNMWYDSLRVLYCALAIYWLYKSWLWWMLFSSANGLIGSVLWVKVADASWTHPC